MQKDDLEDIEHRVNDPKIPAIINNSISEHKQPIIEDSVEFYSMQDGLYKLT